MEIIEVETKQSGIPFLALDTKTEDNKWITKLKHLNISETISIENNLDLNGKMDDDDTNHYKVTLSLYKLSSSQIKIISTIHAYQLKDNYMKRVSIYCYKKTKNINSSDWTKDLISTVTRFPDTQDIDIFFYFKHRIKLSQYDSFSCCICLKETRNHFFHNPVMPCCKNYQDKICYDCFMKCCKKTDYEIDLYWKCPLCRHIFYQYDSDYESENEN
jgi:hypothetical protein